MENKGRKSTYKRLFVKRISPFLEKLTHICACVKFVTGRHDVGRLSGFSKIKR